MFRQRYWVVSSALGALLLVAACDSAAPGGFGNLFAGGSESDGNSVADVSTDGTGMAPSGFPLPGNDAARARVRNESGARVDVTLRFLRDDAVVHLAFVRVPAQTETMPASLSSAASLSTSRRLNA